MTLTDDDRAQIRETAKRAAWGWGGDWTAEVVREVTGHVTEEEWAFVHAEGKRQMVECEDGDVIRHIAGMDPATTLALLDERDNLAAEVERIEESGRLLGDEQCCVDVCNGGACEGCLGCQAGWCVNGHDFTAAEWDAMSDEDRQRWWDVAREHNVGIEAAIARAEAAEAKVAAVEALAAHWEAQATAMSRQRSSDIVSCAVETGYRTSVEELRAVLRGETR